MCIRDSQGAGLLQGGQQGHGIHRAAPYIDGRHGGEDILMLGQVKILGGQRLHRLLYSCLLYTSPRQTHSLPR